ncbi:MAG: thioredoxin family protein [Campylobacterales bacterium]|nr:thioredoxin family protein [Campylobacterales bacterium]
MKNILKSILGLFVLSTISNADAPMLQPVPFSSIKPLIGKGKPIMLEFGSTSCHSCQVMGRLLHKIKAKNPKSNIYFIDIYKDMDASIAYGVQIIPTQVYLDGKGEVVEKHMGVIKENGLNAKLQKMGIINDK